MPDVPFDREAYFQALNAHDLAKVISFYSENVEFTRSPLPEPILGREGVRERIGAFMDAFEGARWEARDVITGPHQAGWIVRFTGRHTGAVEIVPGARVAPTGREVRFDVAQFLTLDPHGGIMRDEGIYDVLGVFRQLGIAPPAAGVLRRA